MNPIKYSDLFDFGDASEPAKFVTQVQEMEKALGELQKAAQNVSASATRTMAANANAAQAAAQRIVQATLDEIAALNQQANALRNSTAAARQAQTQAQAQGQTLGELRKQLSQLTSQYDVTANTAGTMDQQIRDTTQAIKLNQQAIKAAQADTTQANNINIASLKTYNEQSNALNRLRQRYRELNPAIAGQAAEMQRLLVKIQKLDTAVKGTDKTLGNFQRNVGNYPKGLALLGALPGGGDIASLLSGAGGAAAAIGLVVAGIAGIVTGMGKAEQAFIKFEALQKGLKAASDNALEAEVNMNFLFDTADRLGLKVDDLGDSFKSFTAASKGTAIEGQKARDVFESVAIAASSLGISGEATQRALLALGQMMSKGKVQAEELRGQLGEALPGAFGLMAKGLGVTTQELNKMLERGEVLASDALPKLAKVLREEFGAGGVTDTLAASTNRLSNEFTKFWTILGTRLAPALKSAKDGMTGFIKLLNFMMLTQDDLNKDQQADNITETLAAFEKGEITKEKILEKRYAAEKRLLEIQAELETYKATLTKEGVKALTQFYETNRLSIEGYDEVLRAIAKKAENETKQTEERTLAAQEGNAKKSKKLNEDRVKDRIAQERKLSDFLDVIEVERIKVTTFNLQKELEVYMSAMAAKEAAARKSRLPVKNIDSPLAEENADPIASLFSFSSNAIEEFDSFFDYQMQMIENNSALAASFGGIGDALKTAFGDNPFSRFLSGSLQLYQAFLKLKENGLILQRKDTLETNANTAAALKNAGAQGAAAVGKTAAQTGLGALISVPAVLAVLVSAIGLVKGLFAGGFEEGTPFLAKDNATAPLGKDSLFIKAARGERILSHKHNKELGNVGDNNNLVRLAKLGIVAEGKMSDVHGIGSQIFTVQQTFNSDEIAKAIAKEIKGLPLAVNVWDETGYHTRTETMAKATAAHRKWNF